MVISKGEPFDYARFGDFMAEMYALAESRGYLISSIVEYSGPNDILSAKVQFMQREEPVEYKRLRETKAFIRHSIQKDAPPPFGNRLAPSP